MQWQGVDIDSPLSALSGPYSFASAYAATSPVEYENATTRASPDASSFASSA